MPTPEFEPIYLSSEKHLISCLNVLRYKQIQVTICTSQYQTFAADSMPRALKK
jgi:hypothetical protein